MTVSYIASSQIGFLRKQVLGSYLESRIFSKMCPWDQHLWKGEEGSRNGNRGKASWDVGPVIVLVNRTGALELEC